MCLKPKRASPRSRGFLIERLPSWPWRVGFTALFLCALLTGCQSRPPVDPRIRVPQTLIRVDVAGESRFFSSIGFIALDQSLDGRLEGSFGPTGRLQIEELRSLVPDAQITPIDEYVHFVRKGPFPDVLIADNRLVALDPALDEVIIEMVNVSRSQPEPLLPLFSPKF